MNPTYCILLALAIHLETWIGSGEGLLTPYVFVPDGSDVDTAKTNACNALKTHVLDNPGFVRVPDAQDPLGTHSCKKYGTTHPRRCGCKIDFVDHRARWKRKK